MLVIARAQQFLDGLQDADVRLDAGHDHLPPFRRHVGAQRCELLLELHIPAAPEAGLAQVVLRRLDLVENGLHVGMGRAETLRVLLGQQHRDPEDAGQAYQTVRGLDHQPGPPGPRPHPGGDVHRRRGPARPSTVQPR